MINWLKFPKWHLQRQRNSYRCSIQLKPGWLIVETFDKKPNQDEIDTAIAVDKEKQNQWKQLELQQWEALIQESDSY